MTTHKLETIDHRGSHSGYLEAYCSCGQGFADQPFHFNEKSEAKAKELVDYGFKLHTEGRNASQEGYDPNLRDENGRWRG